MINNENKEIFPYAAKFDYGNKEEQIVKPKVTTQIFKESISAVLKPLLFPGASYLKHVLIDTVRIEEARNHLKKLGGQEITLKTPDGDKIDGMYMEAKDFKTAIEKYCDVIEIDNKDGTVTQYLTVKPDLCDEVEETIMNRPYIWMRPDKEARAFLDGVLDKLGLGMFSRNKIPNTDKRGYLIKIGTFSKDLPPISSESNTSQPTVMISPGSGMSFAAYKGLAASYLIRGINVMMIDFRGYGRSKGNPTDYKTKLDLETVYQYLKDVHHVENEDLLVHGHCQGAGPGSDLAGRRKKVNLLIDRSFADYSEVGRERYPKVKGIVEKPCL